MNVKRESIVMHRGIASTEIGAAMDALNVPPRARRRVFCGVRIMAAAAQPLLNGDDG